MRFPSYIHDAAVLDGDRVLVLRSNPDNLKPGFLESWDVDAGKKLFQVSAEGTLAHVLAARKTRAASGDTDGVIRIWNTRTGTLVRRIETNRNKRSVGALAFLDDDRLLAGSSAGFDLWDIRSGARLRTHRLKQAAVLWFAVSARADRIVAACTDRRVRIFNASGRSLRTMMERGLPAYAGRYGSMDTHAATSVCLTDEDQTAVASYGDGSLRCWDVSSGSLLEKTKAAAEGPPWLQSVAASPSGAIIAAGSWDTNVWLWNRRDDPAPAAGHIGEVGPVLFLDEDRVVSVSFDTTIRVWSVRKRKCLRVIGKPIESSRFPPDESMW